MTPNGYSRDMTNINEGSIPSMSSSGGTMIHGDLRVVIAERPDEAILRKLS